jgi:hypothetical protein
MGSIYNDCHKDYADFILQCQIKSGGEEIRFYSQTVESPNADPFRDPLYDEPASDPTTGDEEFKFKGPYKVPAIVKEGSREISASDRGQQSIREDAYAFFARKDFEDLGVPAPKDGDVIEWFGRHYDIVKVSKKGLLGDTLTFTKYDCSLRILDRFTPERRTDSPDVTAP